MNYRASHRTSQWTRGARVFGPLFIFEKLVIFASITIIGICSIILGARANEPQLLPHLSAVSPDTVISRPASEAKHSVGVDAGLTQVCDATSGKLVLTAEVKNEAKVSHGRELAAESNSILEVYEKPDRTLELHWNEGANCRALCLPVKPGLTAAQLNAKASRAEWNCHAVEAPLMSTRAELQWVDLPEKYRNKNGGKPTPKGYLLWKFRAPTQSAVTLRALNGFRFNERVWRRPWSIDSLTKPMLKPAG